LISEEYMADLGPHSEPHPDVAGYLLGTLEPDEAQRFADHLDGCDACREEVEQLAGLPGLLSDLPPPVPVPAGLEERTFAAIEAAVTAGRASDVSASTRVLAPEEPHAPDVPGATVIPMKRPPKKGWRRPPLLALAAAAVLVIGLAVGIVASRSSSSHAPLATIRLVAVGGGPAHGTATVRTTSGGLTIDMTVDDLAPSPSGTFYTCWLVGPGDSLAHPNRVSVGSFVVRGTAPVEVHWTTAANVRQFPQLGVTLEPDNGNPSHQGPKVLSGSLGALA
jgi:anti-sigma-K factor RskA